MRHHRRHHHQDLEPASDHRCCRCRHTHGIRFGPQLRAWSHPLAHLRFHLSNSLGPQLRTRTGRPSRDRVDFSAQEGGYQSNDGGIVSCSLMGCGCGRGRDHGAAMRGWPLLPCHGGGGGGGGIAAGARGGRLVFCSCRGGCIIGFSAASVWVGASAAGSVLCAPVSSCSGVSDKDTLVLLSFSSIRSIIMYFWPIDSCKSRT